jgi:hypothetical protein
MIPSLSYFLFFNPWRAFLSGSLSSEEAGERSGAERGN